MVFCDEGSKQQHGELDRGSLRDASTVMGFRPAHQSLINRRLDDRALRGLHSQQHRGDRADASDPSEPSAAFISSMLGRDLGIDLRRFVPAAAHIP
jgi:hypothetical protein